MRTLGCHPNCRAITNKINDSFCSAHSCWQCGSRTKITAVFYIPRLKMNKEIGFCSEGCIASCMDVNQTWKLNFKH